MKLPNSAKDFEEIMKNVDFTRVLQITVPILQPVIIGGLWLLLSKFDKRADAVSKFIAIAESIPTIDLNLPRPVVLASLYHSIDEALDTLKEVIQTLKDIEVPTAEELIDATKDALIDPILDPLKESETLKALSDCNANAKKSMGYGYYLPLAAPVWIASCMLQKGFNVSTDWIRERI
jgi:hypothetical protein